MTVYSKINPESKTSRLKYLYIVAFLSGVVLWITSYGVPNIDVLESIKHIQQSNDALCTIESYNQGQWEYQPNDINPLTETGVAQAAVLKMNTKKLADHLLEHPVLFVGDSITQLQFESLGCLLGNHFPNRHPNTTVSNGGNSKIRVNQLAPVGSNQVALAYVRSDYLIRIDDYKLIEPFEKEGIVLGSGENHPWVHAFPHFNYIVINTGPHWHPNLHWGPNASEEELLAAFEKSIKVIYDYLNTNIKSHQKVWIRSTPYGHATCSKFKKPQENPLAPSGQENEYEWHLFEKFDALWKTIVKEGNNKHIEFLDISTLSNMRGDAHSRPDRDCLHTCLPGPVDDWNRLIYHEIFKSLD
ncbi:hypothetical protein K501DRAFT_336248 [Backusella circina FSU 941]|nr:hypothetical protein K501DRAFT_336248 [Backusella circina FSU 941]